MGRRLIKVCQVTLKWTVNGSQKEIIGSFSDRDRVSRCRRDKALSLRGREYTREWNPTKYGTAVLGRSTKFALDLPRLVRFTG